MYSADKHWQAVSSSLQTVSGSMIPQYCNICVQKMIVLIRP